MARVLLIDDEITMVQMVCELLRTEGHEVFPCSSASAAMEALESKSPELVITDLYLDKTRAHGLEILQKARALNPPAIVIVITGFGTVETAVEAMKRGAFDYLEKPFKIEDLQLCVQRALTYSDVVNENLYLRKQLRKRYQFSQLVGNSQKMQEVCRMVERVANTDSTVLLLGESGTGKELAARALHFNSRRQFAPFVPVNCSALPENLLESELFGHRKGAFTGAVADKKGLFQEADGGTIFLDEIGSMPLILQSRLLRVLQEREVRRVGDNTPINVNVRVVAATNEPLEKLIKTGAFREDLYYRLNVIPIVLPPLRERRDDIPLLVAHFLRGKAHVRTGAALQISRAAVEVLMCHEWPGNVRELENALERACALSETEILDPLDLPPLLHQYIEKCAARNHGREIAALPSLPGEGKAAAQPQPRETPAPSAPAAEPLTGKMVGALKDFLREQESAYLNRAIAQAGGDKEQAAQLLGISLATLYRKLSEDGE